MVDPLAGEAAMALYRRAFQEFGLLALWDRVPVEQPTSGQMLRVAESLRREGNLASRRLAAQIEAACRAAV